MNVKNLILKKHRIINNSAQDEEFKSNNISTLSWVMSMCTTELVVILTLIITTFFVLNGKITVGAMVMSIQLANQVVNPVLLLSEPVYAFQRDEGCKQAHTKCFVCRTRCERKQN